MIRVATTLPEHTSVEALLEAARGRLEALVDDGAEWEIDEADLVRTTRFSPARVKGRVVFAKIEKPKPRRRAAA